MRTEYLFSYGTLQLEAVQLALFGRRLSGTPDAMPRFRATLLEISDPATVSLSGKTHHSMATFTGRDEDAIDGTVLAMSPEEIERADTYEVAEYKRVAVILRSGTRAWAYVDARYTPQAEGHSA